MLIRLDVIILLFYVIIFIINVIEISDCKFVFKKYDGYLIKCNRKKSKEKLKVILNLIIEIM